MSIKKRLRQVAMKVLNGPRPIVKIELIKADYHGLLKGKKLVITGGSRGIGKAIALKFAKEGAEVLVIGRDENALEKVCEAGDNKIHYLVKDLTDIDSCGSVLSECAGILGGQIDGLVLNAGISLHEGNFLNVTKESYEKQFSTNLESGYFLAQAYIKNLLNHNISGNVLFMSSETGDKYNDLPYGLTKVAINSLVGGLARRVYQRGIRVNAIAPGVTYTDMKSKQAQSIEDYSNNSAAGRFLLPEEIAEVACFLMSDLSKCITGEVIHCDAGSHLKINGTETEYSL